MEKTGVKCYNLALGGMGRYSHGWYMDSYFVGNDVKRITVLFGAGAEMAPPFNFIGGEDFAGRVIDNSDNVMNRAIRRYYTKNMSDWYPTYSSKAINKHRLLKASVRKKILDEVGIETKVNKGGFNKWVIKEYERVMKLPSAEQDEYIREHTSYIGVLDSKFFTLANPRLLGPENFWIVINCYTRAYLILCAHMVYDLENYEPTELQYLELLEKPAETYSKIKATICKRLEEYKGTSYYSIVGELLEGFKSKADGEKNCQPNISIVTSNYTPICETVLDKYSKCYPVSYIHGKLGVFENPYTLQIKDFSGNNFQRGECQGDEELYKSGLWFPFLLLQSGTKPIIGDWQINQYSEMNNAFSHSERLVILGYNIGTDDADINSSIITFLNKRENNQLIFLDYKGLIGEDKVRHLFRVGKNDSAKSSILYKAIDNDNAYDVFRRCMTDSKRIDCL